MSHVAEGLLHAHLDGALDAEGRREWSEAAAHLDVCEDCRRRLEEAREIRDAAGALLAGATAEPAARPAFEELVAAAATRSGAGGSPPAGKPRTAPRSAKTPWWSSPAKLAWAASLVLAVGAGWIGRQLMIEQGAPVPALVTESRVATTGSDDAEPPARFRTADSLADPAPAAPAPSEQQGFADRDRPAARTDEARAEAARQYAREEEVEDLAAPSEAVVGGQAAAPERKAAALEARATEGPRCYQAELPVEEGAGEMDAGDPARLRLAPDGTASLVLGGRPLVGYWEAPDATSRNVELTDGDLWYDLRLAATEAGLRGRLPRGAPPVAAEDNDGEPAGVEDRPAAENLRVPERWDGSVTFTEETCP